MGYATAQIKSRSLLTMAAVLLIALALSCARESSNKILGTWVNISFPAQTLIISKNGETYIVELKNSQLPELNQKFAARYKDSVIYLQGTQTQLFYDERSDRISGVFGLGRNEFRRK